YRFLNAEETLDFYGRLFNMKPDIRNRRAQELIEMVGLARDKKRILKEYSKGMRQRIGLAQALINDPELIILDEPTSGLDPLGTKWMKDLIISLREKGKTDYEAAHRLGPSAHQRPRVDHPRRADFRPRSAWHQVDEGPHHQPAREGQNGPPVQPPARRRAGRLRSHRHFARRR